MCVACWWLIGVTCVVRAAPCVLRDERCAIRDTGCWRRVAWCVFAFAFIVGCVVGCSVMVFVLLV